MRLGPEPNKLRPGYEPLQARRLTSISTPREAVAWYASGAKEIEINTGLQRKRRYSLVAGAGFLLLAIAALARFPISHYLLRFMRHEERLYAEYTKLTILGNPELIEVAVVSVEIDGQWKRVPKFELKPHAVPRELNELWEARNVSPNSVLSLIVPTKELPGARIAWRAPGGEWHWAAISGIASVASVDEYNGLTMRQISWTSINGSPVSAEIAESWGLEHSRK